MRRTWRPPARVRRAPPPGKLAPAAWVSARNLGEFMRKAQQTAASPPPPACPTGLYPYLGAWRESPDGYHREFCLPALSAKQRVQMRALCPSPRRSAPSSPPCLPAGCLNPRCPSAKNRRPSANVKRRRDYDACFARGITTGSLPRRVNSGVTNQRQVFILLHGSRLQILKLEPWGRPIAPGRMY